MKQRNHTSWRLIRSEAGPDLRVFKVRFDWLENPRNFTVFRATVLESSDWINIIALTPEGKVVVVQQYRFGSRQVTTEIPAGLMEAGETHQEAAVRELREETGYTSQDWEYLGWVEPNPAFLNNRCHQWLAKDAVKTHPTQQDESEDVQCYEMTMDEIKVEIKAGRMRNSLILLALSHVLDIWGE